MSVFVVVEDRIWGGKMVESLIFFQIKHSIKKIVKEKKKKVIA